MEVPLACRYQPVTLNPRASVDMTAPHEAPWTHDARGVRTGVGIMATFTRTSAHHGDATADIITFANGTTLTVADSPDHPSRMYCVDCEDYSTPALRVTLLNDEEWTYADDDAADKPLCSTCFGDDLFNDPFDADDALAERAADAEADRRYHEWKDEGR